MILKFNEFINEMSNNEDINEGKWLNRTAGLIMAITSILGGHVNAHAQENGNSDKSNYEQVVLTNNDVNKFIKFWKKQNYTHDGVSLEKLQKFVDKMMNTPKYKESGIKGALSNKNSFANTFLSDILFIKKNGEPISTENCNGNDMWYLLNKCTEFDKENSPMVGFVTIDGTEYFVNIGNLGNWDGL